MVVDYPNVSLIRRWVHGFNSGCAPWKPIPSLNAHAQMYAYADVYSYVRSIAVETLSSRISVTDPHLSYLPFVGKCVPYWRAVPGTIC